MLVFNTCHMMYPSFVIYISFISTFLGVIFVTYG